MLGAALAVLLGDVIVPALDEHLWAVLDAGEVAHDTSRFQRRQPDPAAPNGFAVFFKRSIAGRLWFDSLTYRSVFCKAILHLID